MISLLQRHRPRQDATSFSVVSIPRDRSPNQQSEEADARLQSRHLLVLAYQHLLALMIIMCILYLICRFGFGWTPGTPNPPSVTVHLRGLTDDGGVFDSNAWIVD
jgi:hypothetical protein